MTAFGAAQGGRYELFAYTVATSADPAAARGRGDTLVGGTGRDSLVGGGGPDVFVVPPGGGTTVQGSGGGDTTVTPPAVNHPPTFPLDTYPVGGLTLGGPAAPVYEGDPVTVTATAADPDAGDVLTYSAVGSDAAGLTVDPQTGAVQWRPTDNGTFHFTLTATDLGGLSAGLPVTVVVTDAAPTPAVAGLPAAALPEGSSLALTGSATDPSAADTAAGFTFLWTVAGPAGTQTYPGPALALGPLARGGYTVTLTATDRDGVGRTTALAAVAVTDVAPTAAGGLAGPAQLTEGATGRYALPGAVTDPSAADAAAGFRYSFALDPAGLAADYAHAGTAAAQDFTFADNGPYTVYARVFDQADGYTQYALPVAVTNLAPTPQIGGTAATVDQGGGLTLTAAAADPGGADTAAGFTYAWAVAVTRDGVTTSYTPAAGPQLALAGLEDGVYVVTLTAADKDHAAGTTTARFTVRDVAPTGILGQHGAAAEGGPATIAFTAVTDPSPADTTAGFRYSFATSTAALATSYAAAGTSATSAGFVFADSGTYTLFGRVFDRGGAFRDYSTPVTVADVAPTALAVGGPTAVGEGATAAFTLTGVYDPSPADTAGLRYSFALTPGGLAATYAAAGPASQPLTFGDDGPAYTVYGRVFDPDGGYSDYSAPVAVTNVAPTAAGFAGPTTLGYGQPGAYSLDGVFDPSAADADSLHYSFALTPAGLAATYAGAGTANAFAATPAGNSDFTVYARVFDKDGGANDYSVLVTVTNAAPTAVSAHGPYTIAEGGSLALTGSAADAAGDPLTYSWDVDGDGVFGDAVGATPALTWAQLQALGVNDSGGRTLALRVTDLGGLSTTASATLTVTNVAPTGTLVNSGPVNEGGTATVRFSTATDLSPVDAATLKYSFALSAGALATTYAGAGTAATSAGFVFADSGTYTLFGRVFDQDDGYTEYTTTVVVNNVAPTPAVAVVTAPAAEGDTLALTGSATDPGVNDGPFAFLWTVTRNGAAYASVAGAGLSLPALPDGTYTAVLRATDKDGDAADTAPRTFVVANVAPVVAAVGVAGPLTEGVAATFSSSFADPGSATETYTYTWRFLLRGQPSPALPDVTGPAVPGPLSVAVVPPDDGPLTATLTVTEGGAGGQSGTRSKTAAITNVAPTAAVGNTGPVGEGGSATVSLSNPSDPSAADTAAGFRYSFATDPALLAGTAGAAGTASGQSFTFPDSGSYTVYGRVFDQDDGYTQYMTTVTVADVAPTAAGVAGGAGVVVANGKATVAEGTPATFSLAGPTDVSPADRAAGLHYSFAPTQGGLAASYAGTTGSNTYPYTPADGPGTFTVWGRVLDQDGLFADYSLSVTILNVAPTPAVAGVPAATIDEGGTVSLTGSATDPSAADMTAGFTYAWTVTRNGGPTAYAAGGGKTLSLPTLPHGSYAVTLTAADKDGGTGTTTVTFSVRDVAPTVAAVTVSPTAPVEGSR